MPGQLSSAAPESSQRGGPSPTTATRIIVAAPNAEMGAKLCASLTMSEFNVVGFAVGGEACIRKVSVTNATMALVALDLPGELDGPTTARILRSTYDMPVVIYCETCKIVDISGIVEAGGEGVLCLPCSDDQIAVAVELAIARKERGIITQADCDRCRYRLSTTPDGFEPRVAQGQDTACRPPAVESTTPLDDVYAALSPREREVFAKFMRGASVQRIAGNLEISPHTVRNHLKSIYRKLKVGSQEALRERYAHLFLN